MAEQDVQEHLACWSLRRIARGSRLSLPDSMILDDAADFIVRLIQERDQLAQENARLNAAPWQPIETAPKDGGRVLVWLESYGVCLARWSCDGWYMDSDEYWPVVPRQWMPPPAPPLDLAESKTS